MNFGLEISPDSAVDKVTDYGVCTIFMFATTPQDSVLSSLTSNVAKIQNIIFNPIWTYFWLISTISNVLQDAITITGAYFILLCKTYYL